MEGKGEGASGDREAVLGDEGEVCVLLPVALEEGGHGGLVFLQGHLKSVRHGGRGLTEAGWL